MDLKSFCRLGHLFLDQGVPLGVEQTDHAGRPPSIAQADEVRLARWEDIVDIWKAVKQDRPQADDGALLGSVIERWNAEKRARWYDSFYPYALSDSYVGASQAQAEQELEIARATLDAHNAFVAGLVECNCEDTLSQLQMYAVVLSEESRRLDIWHRSDAMNLEPADARDDAWDQYYFEAAGAQMEQITAAEDTLGRIFEEFENACHPRPAPTRWPPLPEEMRDPEGTFAAN